MSAAGVVGAGGGGSGGAVAIIPARMASVRFPGKMLADRTGRPLVQHVVEAAARARSVSSVAVATDDARVAEALRPFGTRVVMTGEHPNGTSRLAEAARAMGLGAEAVVVNVQGDEPEIEPGLIDAAVAALERTGAPMATVAMPLGPEEEPANPNIVKVVCALDGTAMYFSRALIPFDRDGRGGPDATPLRHVGLYVYRRSFLDTYTTLEPTPAERCESLEQLRVLQHGYRIAVAVCERPERGAGGGIDTPEQYEAFVRRWLASQGRT